MQQHRCIAFIMLDSYKCYPPESSAGQFCVVCLQVEAAIRKVKLKQKQLTKAHEVQIVDAKNLPKVKWLADKFILIFTMVVLGPTLPDPS